MRKTSGAIPAEEGSPPAQVAHRGRPRALTEPEIAEAQKLYWEECLPVRMIADAMSVPHMTVWRAVCAPPPIASGQEN